MGFSFSSLFGGTKKTGKDSAGDHLTNSGRIRKVIQNLIDDRTLLTVKVPGSDETYSSAIIDINAQKKTFSLDELTPPEGHTLLVKKKKLSVNGQTRGALFSFDVSMLNTGKTNGIAFYDMAFPETMDYVQRRAYYRARVSGKQRITVTTFHKETNMSISGYVIDVSTHGISILFNSVRNINRGDILTLCRMTMPDGQKITFDLDVKHAQKMPNERIRIGSIFYDINTKNLRLIEKFVRKVERDSLRNS